MVRKLGDCNPAAGQARPNGHLVMVTGRWLWCARCGAYASSRPVGLLEQCKGKGTLTGERAKAKLREGNHPTKAWGTWVGRPKVCTTEQWREWSEGSRALVIT